MKSACTLHGREGISVWCACGYSVTSLPMHCYLLSFLQIFLFHSAALSLDMRSMQLVRLGGKYYSTLKLKQTLDKFHFVLLYYFLFLCVEKNKFSSPAFRKLTSLRKYLYIFF